jgi:hypothetical protein
MDSGDVRKPLLTGRGLLLIDDFCRATGLDRATVEDLVRDTRVHGAFFPDGRVAGLFDDVLPSAADLRGWGLTVSGDYDPVLLRSYEVDDDDDFDEQTGTGASSWTISWEE